MLDEVRIVRGRLGVLRRCDVVRVMVLAVMMGVMVGCGASPWERGGERETVEASVAGKGEQKELTAKDREIIGKLLEGLKARKDMKFIRVDKTYSAKDAAWYLQYKWDHNKEKVHSVEDFVQLSAYGGEHGEVTYYVEFSDGRRERAKEVLEESVRKLRAGN